MPQHSVPYIALTRTYEFALHWCKRHGIDPRNVKMAKSLQDVRGVAEHHLILINGWNDSPEIERVFDYLTREKTLKIYIDRIDCPIVEKGRIVEWKKGE